MIPIRDTNPPTSVPRVVLILIALNILAFLYELHLPQKELTALMNQYALIPLRDFSYRPLSFSILPFFSTLFLHGGIFHILSNMWILWIFGDNVEDRMGSGSFLIFYILCGLIASLVHVFMNQNSLTPVVGASGAIAGVMGAYLLLFPRSKLVMFTLIIFYPLVFQLPAVIFLVFWFIGQIFSSALTIGQGADEVGIAFWAHIGGFTAGMLLLPIFTKKK
jgi:membrane associated rhomboid family serine protease